MVYLVIGKKNVGKTTRLKSLFGERKDAWGFSSDKINDCGRVTSYVLTDLRTGETRTVAKLASLPVPEDWGGEILHGPFRFSTACFDWALALFRQAVDAGAKAFFIDELGKLELGGDGHAPLVREAVKSGLDLYIAVREQNVDAAAKAFGLGEFTRIDARG